MRAHLVIGAIGVAVLGASVASQQSRHMNPMVDLLSAKKAIFGLGVPTVGRGGGGGGNRGAQAGGTGAAAANPPAPATPAPPPKTPAELAKDAVGHPEADFFFTAMMERNIDGGSATMTALQDALVEVGNVAKSPSPRLLVPINSKAPNISRADMPADPANYVTNISRQLNVGVSSIAFVEVDSAEELKLGIAAMRFKSKGGTRPEDVGNAPKYWGLSEAEYRRKADVWPLNPEGELVVWAIIETKEGLANLKEIAKVPGLSVIAAGAGTLGGVFSTTGADGQRVRDNAAWEAAIQSILATCKEVKMPCAYPVNENDVETRYQQGFTVGILQSFNDTAFRAVAKGRAISGRDKDK
jgi:2-keto-3-deoxy-L-rhamnonate aldolase RhmA